MSPKDRDRFTYETTYEFALDQQGTRLVRLWLLATCAEYARAETLQRLNELRLQVHHKWSEYQRSHSLSDLADWIAHTFSNVAAVQTIDKVTGFGNVIYVDWP